MITLNKKLIVIEDLEQILLMDENRTRCLCKESIVECFGQDFHVQALSDAELTIQGKCHTINIHEREN